MAAAPTTLRNGAGFRRFEAGFPCPVCGGSDDDPRGEGRRCFGFLSGDGGYAHCSRAERAGSLPVEADAQTYAHRLNGPCKCGATHGPALDRPGPKAARRPWTPPGDVEAEFLYRDGGGQPFLKVVRYRVGAGKTFRQFSPAGRQPGGSLRWVSGTGKRAPIPYRLPELVSADPGETVFIVEGERKADALALAGRVATCNPMGAGKWRDDMSPHLAGRHLVILPDNDEPGRSHAASVARSVVPHAASVRIVELPGLPVKGDLLDWLASGRTLDEMEALARKTPAWSAPDAELNGHATSLNGAHSPPGSTSRAVADGEPIRPNESPDDPSRIARIIIDSLYRHEDGLALRFWQGDFLEWANAYHSVLIDDIRARVHREIKAEFDRLNVEEIARWQRENGAGESAEGAKGRPRARKVTGQLVSNVVLALTGYSRLAPLTPQPSWLAGPIPFPAEDVLPARNALVYLPGLVAGHAGAIHPPTPRFFGPYALDYDFDPAAPRPDRWLRFLDSLWPNDPESIATLQEWFGLLLTPDTSHQKILLLIGPKRSGKGTIARILKGMIGPENVANPTLSGLATNFGLAPLIGKPAAIITDARLSGRTDVAQVVERLLSISGEDSQTIDRKHQPALTVKLPTRFTLISNELPRLTDTSGALAGRLILQRLTRSFYGKEDKGLTEALLTELPSILLWSIEGWRRLRDRGRFVQPASGAGMIEEMEDLASPVGAFLKDRCELEAGAEVKVADLYESWKGWCKEHGRDNPGDELMFGRNLRTVLPNLNTPYRRQPDGSRKRSYEGIRLVGSV